MNHEDETRRESRELERAKVESPLENSDSPMGGWGLSPAFPVGTSLRIMRAHKPILEDFGICYHDYQK